MAGALIASVSLSVVGCGDSSGTVPVNGQVTFRGQPLPNATLAFFPKTGRPVLASVSDGDYCTELVPGDYSITVTTAFEMPQGYGRTHWNQLPPQTFQVPEDYTSRARTPLNATVAADQSESINFELK